jgi:hypothetical protein
MSGNIPKNDRRLKVALVVSGTLLMGLSSCGEGQQRHVANGAGSLFSAEQRIKSDLTSAFAAKKFMCLRLGANGKSAVIVVSYAKQVAGAINLLRFYEIDGTIEVKTSLEYERGIQDLGLRIENVLSHTASLKSAGRTTYEELHGALMCPKVGIDVGTEIGASPVVVAWARSTVAQYGSGRVKYFYSGPGKEGVGTSYPLPPYTLPVTGRA